jgi:hypothetical protein
VLGEAVQQKRQPLPFPRFENLEFEAVGGNDAPPRPEKRLRRGQLANAGQLGQGVPPAMAAQAPSPESPPAAGLAIKEICRSTCDEPQLGQPGASSKRASVSNSWAQS